MNRGNQMDINGLKVVEARMPETNLETFLNPEFLELLKSEMDDVKVIHIGLASGTDDEMYVSSLAHICSEHSKQNILSINVKNEEHMDQLVDAIRLFKKEG